MANHTITVELDGQPVPLAECGWLKRKPCGCIVAAVVAVVPGAGGWTIADTDQAHRSFTPRKDSRAREIQNGVTVELITMAYYREHIGAKWECPAHVRPAATTAQEG